MATLNAQRGVWNCVSDMDKDTYGRILWHCDDLARDQIKKGLAHTMTITKNPAPEPMQALQREAMKNKVGIWAHGIPAFVLTSAHSVSEIPFQKETYDRFVSTTDGHSQKVPHSKAYEQCEKICYDPAGSARQSCVVYVDFKVRYGEGKPDCLKLKW